MRRFALRILIIAAVAAGSTVALSQTDLSDEELLIVLDAARLFEETTTGITVSIVARTTDDTKTATTRLRFKTVDGQEYARIEFLEPEELAGQIYLSTPEATYFIGPDLDFPIKTSATRELFGDAAIAQTSGIEFAKSYTLVGRRDINLEDGSPALEVDLEAIDYSVAFQAVTVRVDLETLQPLTMTLYALSGLPFYKVSFTEYALNEEDLYVKRQRIENQLLVGNVTDLEVVEITSEAFPDNLFDPEELRASE